MAVLREIQARSMLSKSGISDYSVNCYVGCTHACVYCYARFMKRFTGHTEPWGQFLDARVNAPEVLAKEVKRKSLALQNTLLGQPHRPHVFMSSVCDAYQPAEKRYELTRRCLAVLLEAGFDVGVLTKSKLVTRDFDIMSGYKHCSVGCTLTTMDENLRFCIEPGASPTRERIAALEQACGRGIDSWAFLGPFMPGLSDSDEALDALFSAVAPLPLSSLIADKLNPKAGLWNTMAPFLNRHYPDLLELYRHLFFERDEYRAYCEDLRIRIMQAARTHRVDGKLKGCF